MKALLFGQIGLRKKRCVSDLKEYARNKDQTLRCFNVGDMMYQVTPGIRPHRILQKDIAELTLIRQRVWDQIIAETRSNPDTDYVINTHSTFRWSNGLFPGFTNTEITSLGPDLCITLIDDVQDIKYSLNLRPVKPEPFTLKDIIVWREEEILAAEFAASLVPGCKHYLVPKNQCPELLFKLIFQAHLRKAYLSYPITNVLDNPEIWADVTTYRNTLKNLLVCFDPISISENSIKGDYLKATATRGRKLISIRVEPENQSLRLPISEVKEVIPNIEGQTIARDFKLIDQSDMVIAYIPEISPRLPAVSTGVERELEHAQQSTMETYVIWPSTRNPSPFQQATRTFRNLAELTEYLHL